MTARTRAQSATDRHIAAQIAANTRWGRKGDEARREATAPARRGLMARFEREFLAANEGTEVTEAEVIAGAERLMKAHMQRLAQKRRKPKRAA
jgi:hypothetical protein